MAGPSIYSHLAFHANVPLTQLSLAYINKQESFIADKVVPVIDVDKDSDSYYVYDEAHLISENLNRAAGTELKLNSFGFTTSSYTLQWKNAAAAVPYETQGNADQQVDPMVASMEFEQHRMLLDKERDAATLIFSSGNYASGNKYALSGSDQWSDYANSINAKSPIKQIMSCAVTIHRATLVPYDKMVLILGDSVWKTVANHPSVTGRLQNAEAAGATRMKNLATIADLCGVGQVLIGQAGYNSAKEGATTSMAAAWTATTAALVYAGDPIGRNYTSFGIQFRKRRGSTMQTKDGRTVNLVGVNTFSDPMHFGDVVSVHDAWQFKSTRTGAGFLWLTAAAS